MKAGNKIFILFLFLFLIILLIGFTISNKTLTGFVTNENQEANKTKIVTEQDVLDALEESVRIKEELSENNFSAFYIEDILIEANRELEKVRYAEILRNPNSSETEVSEAKKALQLINWQELNYSSVLIYTDQIKERKYQAFDIYDSILAIEIQLKSSEEKGDNFPDVESKLQEARLAFSEERYEDSLEFIDETKKILEKELEQTASFNILTKNARGFIKNNLVVILVLLIVLVGSGFFTYKKIHRKSLKKKIEKLYLEKKILLDLIRKAQLERFKENSISGLLYNIKIKKYEEKINKIKQTLPILEKELYDRKNFSKKGINY